MNEESNNIDSLRITTGEELEAQSKYQYDLTQNWLDLSINYPSPRFLLEYKGVGFSPLGGIQALSGHQKNGKTFVLCQLMAAILEPESNRMRELLPGLKGRKDTIEELQNHTATILYCDTEQEIENTARVARRVHYLCGWDWSKGNPRFRVLWLRAEESVSIRWGKIKQAIDEYRPTAIFLDGIRDVIGDFNDNEQSANLISECMSIATKNDCCIWAVLHENPGSDKMRGHLGTELGNKVSDTFVSRKEKTLTGVTFKVSQIDARGKDVEDWKFEITDDAGGLGIPKMLNVVSQGVANQTEDSEDAIKKDFVRKLYYLMPPPKVAYYTNIVTYMKDAMHWGDTKVKKMFNEILEENPTLYHKIQDGRWEMDKTEVERFLQDLPF